jgi:hypothetical protein
MSLILRRISDFPLDEGPEMFGMCVSAERFRLAAQGDDLAVFLAGVFVSKRNDKSALNNRPNLVRIEIRLRIRLMSVDDGMRCWSLQNN